MHVRQLPQMRESFRQDGGSHRIARSDKAVVHPAALAARRNNPGTAQVGQMARDLWLAYAQNFDEVTDADFLAGDEIEQAQTSAVSKDAEERLDRNRLFLVSHRRILYMA